MTRRNLWFALPGAVLLLSACGKAQPVVTAELEVEDAEGTTVVRPIADLEVRLFPFDRDEVFDSLAAAAPTPEPEIPDSVLQAQAEVRAAQEAWQQLESRWNTLRDTLQKLSDALDGMSRAQAQYRVLFREFQDLESQYNRIDRQVKRAFERFTQLQEASIAAAEQARLRIEQWEDEAFADVGEVMAARLRETGREIHYDTTDAQGVATFQGQNIEPGTWWVTARYEGPFTELYWNVRVELPKGEPTQIRLTRENAEERPKL